MCAFYLAFCTSKKQAVRPDGTGHPGAGGTGMRGIRPRAGVLFVQRCSTLPFLRGVPQAAPGLDFLEARFLERKQKRLGFVEQLLGGKLDLPQRNRVDPHVQNLFMGLGLAVEQAELALWRAGI